MQLHLGATLAIARLVVDMQLALFPTKTHYKVADPLKHMKSHLGMTLLVARLLLDMQLPLVPQQNTELQAR